MMTTNNSTPEQRTDGYTDLGAAFADKSGQQQESGRVQEPQTNVDNGSVPTPSTPGTTTPPSSDTTTPRTTTDVAGLTLEEIKAHPTLGKQWQSSVDSAAANMLAGKTREIETRVRQEITLESAKAHFDALSPEELGTELKDPTMSRLYADVQTMPQPTSVEATLVYYTNTIRDTTDRLNTSGLDDATKQTLNPNLHLLKAGEDPNALLKTWVGQVNKAITDGEVAKAVAAATGTQQKSDELEKEADNDQKAPPGPLLTNGRTGPTLPNFDTTSGDALLTDAFARTSATRR